MAEQYSKEDQAKHTELSIKKANGDLTSEEQVQLTDLRKRQLMQSALDGNKR